MIVTTGLGTNVVRMQLSTYNFVKEANFCTLKMAVEPEENCLQHVHSTLTFDLWV